MKPIVELFRNIGGWPLIDGVNWNESNWDWEESILKFREQITNRTDNPFRKTIGLNEIEDAVGAMVIFLLNILLNIFNFSLEKTQQWK